MSDYQLPEVWEAPSQMGGAWGGLEVEYKEID